MYMRCFAPGRKRPCAYPVTRGAPAPCVRAADRLRDNRAGARSVRERRRLRAALLRAAYGTGDVSELLAEQRELQRRRHALGVGVSEACEPPQRLDHVSEALAGG